ncbi:transcriptional regulator, PaaX family [Nocardioides terrae]|uniref:Transcriptional regulator, PaaX family n=1 Tax=Nocardioides terrae TaxID=574651 RepID=A0A1I1K9G5_9ACTN|nr:PaaX family transcriptional regulator C-terminal domain-containing protein [Nocardioides terrae]SFC57161.1 transcriptional regulator, PaaX family [Nocardioides terrae]
MSEAPEGAVRGPQPRTTIVTFLGAVVRPLGGWMPIAAAVDLLGEVGIDAPSVRTAVFRLKKNGWLDPASRSGARGYLLTEEADATLAAGDEVIWHARKPADLSDGWCIVHFGVPESMRAKRHQLRSHLTSLGFGNIGTALWIAPARMRQAAERAIEDLGLGGYAAIFVGDYFGPQDLTRVLYDSWDLAAIDRGYRDFIDAYRSQFRQLSELAGAEAFAAYLTMLDRWRKLPFRDPGLPREVLAADWPAGAAVALFEELVAVLEGPALDHARASWGG